MKKILLDTNAYTRLLAGDAFVLHALAEADTVFISIFVLGELYAGFRGGARESQNRSQLKDFMRKPTVRILSANEDTAEIFGKLKHQLKTAGTPIPLNDVWIAAHSLESGSQLITYDAHFTLIPGLLLWKNPA